MQSIFAHEAFPECGCCACGRGFLEVSGRGGFYFRTGYEAFDGSGKLFRTIASRGWGGYGPGLTGPIQNDAQCSFGRAFTIYDPVLGLTPMTYYGSMSSILWITGNAYPWGPSVDDGTPDVEITDCADGLMDFDSADFDEDFHAAYEMDGINEPLGPRGVTHLANEITAAGAFLELKAYVETLAWPTTYTRCFSENTDHDPCEGDTIRVQHKATPSDLTPLYMVYEGARYRRRFSVPPGGSIRFEWDIYFTPQGGAPELYDTVSWQWDGVVPGGYDLADPETWPATPWYEMPGYEPTLGYGSFAIGFDDWRVTCESDLAAMAPGFLAGVSA